APGRIPASAVGWPFADGFGVFVGFGPPGFVGCGPSLGGGGTVTHGTITDGSGVGGPPPGSSQIGGWAVQTLLGAKRPPHVRPNGLYPGIQKYGVGVRPGPPE